jgi:hypothetical protein
MTISFGYPHYRIFEVPKPEKKLPKCAELKKCPRYIIGMDGCVTFRRRFAYQGQALGWSQEIFHAKQRV